MRRFIQIVVAFALWVLPVGISPAFAQPAARTKAGLPASQDAAVEKMEEPKTIVLDKLGGIHDIVVAPGRSTFVDMPGHITHHSVVNLPPTVDVISDGKKVRITPTKEARTDIRIDVHVDFVFMDIIASHVSLDVTVKPRKKADPPLIIIRANKEAIKEWARAFVANEIVEAREQGRAEGFAEGLAKGEQKQLTHESKQSYREASDSPDNVRDQLIASYETATSPGAEQVTPRLLPTRWTDAGTYLLTNFEICNRDPKPFRLAEVQTTAPDGREYEALVTFVDQPSFGKDGLIAIVENRMCLRGVVAVQLDRNDGVHALDIEWREPGGSRWLRAKVSAWTQRAMVLKPLVPAESHTPRDRFMEAIRQREARKARGRQLILGPSVSYGACWLTDGMADATLDITGCTAVGVRVTKGITEMIAFETEVTGGWTGQAEFMDGTRSATIGRVTAGGLLRFGDRTVPYFRLAIGVQGTNYDSTFTGADDSFELDFTWGIGGGLYARRGEHFTVGAMLMATQEVNSGARSVHGGLQVGYGWNP